MSKLIHLGIFRVSVHCLVLSIFLFLTACVGGDYAIYTERYHRAGQIHELEQQINKSVGMQYGHTILLYDLLDLGHSKKFHIHGSTQVSSLYLYLTSQDMTKEKFDYTISRLKQIVITKTINPQKTRMLLEKKSLERIKYLHRYLNNLLQRLTKAKLDPELIRTLNKLQKKIENSGLSTVSLNNKLAVLAQVSQTLEELPVWRPMHHCRVTDRFRMRPGSFMKSKRMHKGIDLAGHKSCDVFVTAKGYVKFAGKMGSYGNVVIVDHGNGVETYYAHLRKIATRVGRKLLLGECIGIQGNTGRSSGEHLHYEVRLENKPVNPEIFTSF